MATTKPDAASAAQRPADYLTAIGSDLLLPLYDPVLRWIMREAAFKGRLIAGARIDPGMRVLDLGCGTATLTMMIKQAQPAATVVGLDGDAVVLARARRKIAAAGIDVHLELGLADSLPFDGQSFDRVLSSLVLHHLRHDVKLRALREVWRVLKPGGGVHVVDFGPQSHLRSWVARHFHHHERVDDNLQGRLPALLSESGFGDVEACGTHRTLVGSLSFYRACKPGG